MTSEKTDQWVEEKLDARTPSTTDEKRDSSGPVRAETVTKEVQQSIRQQLVDIAAQDAAEQFRRDTELDAALMDIAAQDAAVDRALRKETADKILNLFKNANMVAIFAISLSMFVDYVFIGTKLIEPADRLINENIIMAFLGATTVQVGTIMVAVSRYLFPSAKKNSSLDQPGQGNPPKT